MQVKSVFDLTNLSLQAGPICLVLGYHIFRVSELVSVLFVKLFKMSSSINKVFRDGFKKQLNSDMSRLYKPCHEKTCVCVSNQVSHKRSCTTKEDG